MNPNIVGDMILAIEYPKEVMPVIPLEYSDDKYNGTSLRGV